MDGDWLSTSATAKRLGRSRRHVIDLLQADLIKGFQTTPGGPWSVCPKSVEALIERGWNRKTVPPSLPLPRPNRPFSGVTRVVLRPPPAA
jgi:hypothetical protein